MKYMNLKGTDLKISRIALGTAAFGRKYDADTSEKFLDLYCSEGGNLIDTALVYASSKEAPFMSEITIGNWMKKRGNRKELILTTKGGHPFGWISGENRCSKKNLLKDIDQSLLNLKTDYVDIYWIHKDNRNIPVEELMEALTEIVKEGKARYAALSNMKADRAARAMECMEVRGGPRIIASQILYNVGKINEENMFDKEGVAMTPGEYAFYKERKLPVFAYASQAHGFFGKLQTEGIEKLPEGMKDEYLNQYNLELFERLKKAALDYGCSVSQMAMAALIQRGDFDTIPIVGFSKKEQLEETLGSLEITLSNETRRFIFNL